MIRDVLDVPLAVEATLRQAAGFDIASGLLSGPDVNRVVIAGMDTTWVLEVREPWK